MAFRNPIRQVTRLSELVADKIDGATITGGILRTAEAGTRWVIESATVNQIKGYVDGLTGGADFGPALLETGYSATPGSVLRTFLRSPRHLATGARASLTLGADAGQSEAYVDAETIYLRPTNRTYNQGPLNVSGPIVADSINVGGRSIVGVNFGHTVIDTDANGWTWIGPHLLGAVPSAISVQAASHYGDATVFMWDQSASTTSNLRVRLVNHANTPIASQTRTVTWIAYR